MSESGSNGKTRRPIDKRRMKASSRPTTWFRRIRHERQFKECSRRHYYRSATATTRHNLSSYTPSATSISNPLRTAVSFRLSRLWQIALVRFRLRLEQILSSFCSGGKFMLLVSLLTYLDPLVPYHYSDGWFPIVDFRHRKNEFRHQRDSLDYGNPILRGGAGLRPSSGFRHGLHKLQLRVSQSAGHSENFRFCAYKIEVHVAFYLYSRANNGSTGHGWVEWVTIWIGHLGHRSIYVRSWLM